MQTLTALRCKRCGGDLFQEEDQYGIFLSCLQCSAEHKQDGTLPQPSEQKRQPRGYRWKS